MTQQMRRSFGDRLLRKFVKESLGDIQFFGLKKTTLDDIKERAPGFCSALEKDSLSDFITNCKFAVRQVDKIKAPVFYALFPDSSRTLMVWENDRCDYSRSESLARAIENL